jgi:hypothetical protein
MLSAFLGTYPFDLGVRWGNDTRSGLVLWSADSSQGGDAQNARDQQNADKTTHGIALPEITALL